jgi:hypothetical protein
MLSNLSSKTIQLIFLLSILFLGNWSYLGIAKNDPLLTNSHSKGIICSLGHVQNAQVLSKEVVDVLPFHRTRNAISSFHEGLAFISEPDYSKAALIDRNGREITNLPSKLRIVSSSEGLLGVAPAAPLDENPRKLGFIDRAGKFVIKPQYEFDGNQFYGFSSGLSVARSGGKYGFIDHTGKWFISPKFDFAKDFSEGLAAIKVNGRWGFINTAGEVVIPPKFQDGISGIDGNFFEFSEGLSPVRVGQKIGYIDSRGQFVILPKFDEGSKFSEGLASVKVGEKRGYINALGQMVITPKFYVAGEFSEGLAPVIADSPTDGKFGFIDTSGELIAPAQFDYAEKFSEGFSVVLKNDRWGFIDKSGKIVVPTIFSSATGFSEGAASVSIDVSSDQSEKISQVNGFLTHRDVTSWLKQCDHVKQ